MASDKVTVPQIRAIKASDTVSPIAMVTAYDAPSARMADAAGADIVLVGDSLANVVLGYEDTLSVTVSDMAYHTAAVARVKPKALIVTDLPWLSYHTGVFEAVRNAAQLIKAGAECVKLEGGSIRKDVIKALVETEIPVMGHLGLTPQSVHALGGYSVQAKTRDTALRLLDDAYAIQEAGVFSIVLEAVPSQVAKKATESLKVPTIGIGAGPHCDGQVLVFHDLVGLSFGRRPKFVRQYGNLGEIGTKAIEQYVHDVKMKHFPAFEEGYNVSDDQLGDLNV